MAVWARGGDRLEHCRQYARQKKMAPEAAMRLFGLEEPQIPPGLEFVWNWFFELAAGRAHNGFAWQPIAWADMAAWASVSGIRLAPWLAACFRAMDREWLKIQADEQEKKNKNSENGIRNNSTTG